MPFARCVLWAAVVVLLATFPSAAQEPPGLREAIRARGEAVEEGGVRHFRSGANRVLELWARDGDAWQAIAAQVTVAAKPKT